jgi:hypothetical protein
MDPYLAAVLLAADAATFCDKGDDKGKSAGSDGKGNERPTAFPVALLAAAFCSKGKSAGKSAGSDGKGTIAGTITSAGSDGKGKSAGSDGKATITGGDGKSAGSDGKGKGKDNFDWDSCSDSSETLTLEGLNGCIGGEGWALHIP